MIDVKNIQDAFTRLMANHIKQAYDLKDIETVQQGINELTKYQRALNRATDVIGREGCIYYGNYESWEDFLLNANDEECKRWS